jgi:hypothetical protein
VRHPEVKLLLQVWQVLWQLMQFPFESMKYPALQLQLFGLAPTSPPFGLQLVQPVLSPVAQDKQVLWQP